MGNQATKMRNGRIDGKNRWSTRTTMEELWRCKILGLGTMEKKRSLFLILNKTIFFLNKKQNLCFSKTKKFIN
jgi:hypothetical protein